MTIFPSFDPARISLRMLLVATKRIEQRFYNQFIARSGRTKARNRTSSHAKRPPETQASPARQAISEPPTPTFTRFLDLPLELREMIYEYCLVMPGEIVPYPSLLEKKYGAMNPKCERPTVDLLQVSHQVREESRRFLYGKNVWRLSWERGSRLPTTVWEANVPYYRHVTTTFDYNDITPELLAELGHEPALRFHEFECLCQMKLLMIRELMYHGSLVTPRLEFSGLGDHLVDEDREARWEMIQNLEEFQQITRGLTALRRKDFEQPARQRVWQNLITDPSRVKRRPGRALYIILTGLVGEEYSELIRKANRRSEEVTT
ncbi:MAG: hypothetical protein Q9169_006876 [Polycauliona sp. 2 TL-2023]